MLFIVVLVGMIGLNTGFFNKHVDMKFIQKPDAMYIVSNLHEKEINELLKQLDAISKQQGTEIQQSALGVRRATRSLSGGRSWRGTPGGPC